VVAQHYIRNLFDEQGQLSPRLNIFPVSGPVLVSMTQPRTVGVTVSTKF
jgi:hypothetical protein